jgi:hypothetical protein
LHDKNRSNVVKKVKPDNSEKKGINIKSHITKPRKKRNLNVKKILKPEQKKVRDSSNSQDNKGDKG